MSTTGWEAFFTAQDRGRQKFVGKVGLFGVGQSRC